MYVAIRVAVMSAIAICYQLARGQHSIEETFAMAVVAVVSGHAAVYGIRGLRTRGWSYPKIAAKLNDEGIPGAHGGSWWPMTVKRVAGEPDQHRLERAAVRAVAKAVAE